jgi:hypothetical protein
LALSLSHPAIKTLLARSLLSTWSLLGPTFPTRGTAKLNAKIPEMFLNTRNSNHEPRKKEPISKVHKNRNRQSKVA